MTKNITVTLTLLLLTNISNAQQLTPFTSDGCSRFPNGTPAQQDLWLECCERHDFAYWRGGTYAERLSADEALEACVADLNEPIIASLMYMGVRVGGTPFAPTDFRWGYGWTEYRGYRALSEAERREVARAIDAMDPLESARLLQPSVLKHSATPKEQHTEEQLDSPPQDGPANNQNKP
ncbi:FAD-binding oxidoreductase [Gilvimarinus sp. DA14]|uniref:FAD-binding oxidoreductase n=1 Tax=Gilvimarinus sp. DA14 TaxID=2956798 RepID=UPI0020B70173|nr:FAD-binding oxidoreductase [Gilvimarinus sp. DA14]UTF58989.1 FAD-binding oxidoreductase [Gilvimarinus sp. DA14]